VNADNPTVSSPADAFRTAWASFVSRLTPRFVLYSILILTVAGVAAYVSWGHLKTVAEWGHQTGAAALTLPLSVDGMLGVCSLAMAEDKANRCKPRGWARFGFWLGALVSLAGNWASIYVLWGWDPLALAVSCWAPIALLVVVETIARKGKPLAKIEAETKAAVRSDAAKRGAETRRTNQATGGQRRTRSSSKREKVTHGTPKAPAAAQVSPGAVPLSELNAGMAGTI
jgi:hypothetical protein